MYSKKIWWTISYNSIFINKDIYSSTSSSMLGNRAKLLIQNKLIVSSPSLNRGLIPMKKIGLILKETELTQRENGNKLSRIKRYKNSSKCQEKILTRLTLSSSRIKMTGANYLRTVNFITQPLGLSFLNFSRKKRGKQKVLVLKI